MVYNYSFRPLQIEIKMTSFPRFIVDSFIYSSEATIAAHLLTIAIRYIQRESKRSIGNIVFVFLMICCRLLMQTYYLTFVSTQEAARVYTVIKLDQ